MTNEGDQPVKNVQQLWQAIRDEAQLQTQHEPVLASFYHANILSQSCLGDAVASHIAGKLANKSVSAMLICQVFKEAMTEDAGIMVSVYNDIIAWQTRDAACDYYSMPLLYFKGFQALQAYRISHWLWNQNRRLLALFLQSRIAAVFDVDIHPAAKIGYGIMIDHATGVVIGETAVLGNNVSLLHSVTLGGCGSGEGRRHPIVADGVLISAGAKLLGSINIGEGAKIAAGSVVLSDVADHVTVAGVPAKVVGKPNTKQQPALDMNQQINDC